MKVIEPAQRRGANWTFESVPAQGSRSYIEREYVSTIKILSGSPVIPTCVPARTDAACRYRNAGADSVEPLSCQFTPREDFVRGINHLVIAARDLDALCQAWERLGFMLAPRGQHPFGTANTVIQLQKTYIELLAVTQPEDVPEHEPDRFSFAAFNRDYLQRHDGFSMLVFDSEDAPADLDAWRAAGLRTYDRFEFSRPARMADGREVTVGFSLAFASSPAAPWLGTFACQHFTPEYFAQPTFQAHTNMAVSVHDVWISGPRAQGLTRYFETVIGTQAMRKPGRIDIPTSAGTIVLADPGTFEAAFGVLPPHPGDGPHLAGLTIDCRTLDGLQDKGLDVVEDRLVLPPDEAFGTAVAFRRG